MADESNAAHVLRRMSNSDGALRTSLSTMATASDLITADAHAPSEIASDGFRRFWADISHASSLSPSALTVLHATQWASHVSRSPRDTPQRSISKRLEEDLILYPPASSFESQLPQFHTYEENGAPIDQSSSFPMHTEDGDTATHSAASSECPSSVNSDAPISPSADSVIEASANWTRDPVFDITNSKFRPPQGLFDTGIHLTSPDKSYKSSKFAHTPLFEEETSILNLSDGSIPDTKSPISSEKLEVPSWVSDLRLAWQQELEIMEKQHQSPVHVQVERRTSLNRLKSFINRRQDKDEFTRDKVEKLKTRYNSFISKRENNLRSLEKKEKDLLGEYQSKLRVFNRWVTKHMIPICRRLGQVKWVRITCLKRVEEAFLLVMKQSVANMSEFLDLGQQVYRGPKFEDPLYIIQATPEAKQYLAQIKYLDVTIRDLERQWAVIRKDLPMLAEQDRKNMFLGIVLSTKHNPELGFHEDLEHHQQTFNNLIFDERYKDGQKIRRFREILDDKSSSDFIPEDVVDFIQEYADELCVEWGLTDSAHPSIVRLYLMRAIFPRIQSFCAAYNTSEESLMDAQYPKRVRSLKVFQASESAPTYKFIPSGRNIMEAIEPAANILSELNLFCVPSDISHCILRAGRKLAQGLHLLAGKDIDLAADDIFPLFTKVVLHAEISAPHQAIGYLERFSHSRDHMSEFGYWRTSLKASVSFVMESEST